MDDHISEVHVNALDQIISHLITPSYWIFMVM